MNKAKVAGPNQTKVCTRCNRELSLECYCKGNGMYGKRSICRDCDRIIHNTDEYRERRRIRRDERRKNEVDYAKKEREKNLRSIIENYDSYRKYLIRGAKQRASMQNIPFDITYLDIEIPEYCPLLGIKLQKHIGKNVGIQNDSPTIDKIIPNLGYVKGNVWVISAKANRMKSNATVEELELLVKNLKTHKIH